MKKALIILLTLCILSSAMLSRYGLSQEYVLPPYQYVERIKTVIDNVPTTDRIDIDFDVFHDEAYQSVQMNIPTWVSVNVEGLSDVIPAVGRMFTSLGTFVGDFFREVASIIPRLWNNFLTFSRNVLGLIPKVIVYLGKTFKKVYSRIDYFKCVILSFIPLDWEKMQEDGSDIRLLFFGALSQIPIVQFFRPAGGT